MNVSSHANDVLSKWDCETFLTPLKIKMDRYLVNLPFLSSGLLLKMARPFPPTIPPMQKLACRDFQREQACPSSLDVYNIRIYYINASVLLEFLPLRKSIYFHM